ncbi:GTP-dependent dephospho-CoA kinase family protein [Salinigranum sp. GCM10025319]|uniref:GTP-dependent dephospho-CoA kinase family protein n=1 Tax=Salinigranum sp. GCM10025319 TaxID=3252687 RepID=UPI003616ADE2
MLRLPRSLRSAFKEPFGPVYTDAETLLEATDGPVIAVGDVVAAHLVRAGRTPDVAVIDGRTKREAVSPDTEAALESLPAGEQVTNPAGELTEPLLRALVAAIDADEPRVLDVDGEEDLATLPAVVAAADGTSVVYGQPDEGMVLVRVTPETRAEMIGLLERFDGDVDAALSLLVDDR